MEKPKKNKFLGEMGSLAYTLLIVLFLQSFFIQSYGTPTGSMFNTILIGDRMFFNKFIYGASSPRNIPFTDVRLPYFTLPAIREPRQGDVVTFEWPGNRDSVGTKNGAGDYLYILYLKRIIGTPGDVIRIDNKKVFVNDIEMPYPQHVLFMRNAYKRDYVNMELFPKGSTWNEDFYGPLRVPKKGDVIELNPENYYKWDTFIRREGHKVEVGKNKLFIDGNEVQNYTIKKDYFFMMGDNRDNSLDSRFWGFVPRDAIVGKAWLIYWSWNSDIPFSRFGDLINSIRWDRVLSTIE